MFAIEQGRVSQLDEARELSATATMPGDFARHLDHKHGLARRFRPVDAWFVDADKPQRVRIVEVRGARLEYIGPADYALTEDGRLLPTFYLFPAARHLKPRLATLADDMGTYTQWIAPLSSRYSSPWA